MKSVVQVFAFDVASKVMMAFVVVLLIRYLSPTEYARYTFATSLVLAASGALASGFNRVFIVGEELLSAGQGEDAFVGLQFWGILLVGLLISPAAAATGGLFWIILALMCGFCLTDFVKTLFQREQRFWLFSTVEIVRSLAFSCGVALLAIFLRDRLKAWHVLLLQAATLMSIVYVFLRARAGLQNGLPLGPAVRLAKKVFQSHYVYLFGYVSILAVLSQMDVLVLKAVANERALAAYGSSSRYYALMILALNSVHAVLLPAVQRAETAAEIYAIFRRLRGLLALYLIPAFAGLVACQWIIPWIDKGKYPEAVGIFRILGVSAAISAALSPYTNVLFKLNDFRFLFRLVTLVLFLALALNIALAKAFGPMGSAIANLVDFGLMNFLAWRRALQLLRSFQPRVAGKDVAPGAGGRIIARV